MYSNVPPTIFAPGGRLFSVEKTLESVNADHPANNLVIAIRCQQGTVVVTSEVLSAYILTTNATESSGTTASTADEYSSSFQSLLLPDTGVPRPPFSRLATNLWGITAGNAVDGQLLRLQLHSVAENIRFAQDTEDDSLAQPGTVARRLADRRQSATQQPNDEDGLLNATALVFHRDDLWRVDPTGQFYQCQAAIVGRRAHVAEADLVRELAKRINGGDESELEKIEHDSNKLQRCLSGLSSEDALKLATDCIRNTLTAKTSSSSSPTKSVSMRALILQDRTQKWMSNAEL